MSELRKKNNVQCEKCDLFFTNYSFNLDAFVLTVGLCSVLFVFEHVMFSNWRLVEQL